MIVDIRKIFLSNKKYDEQYKNIKDKNAELQL